MNRMITLFSLIAVALIAGCSNKSSDNAANDNPNNPLGNACSLDGTWTRCSNASGGSTHVALTGAGPQFNQVVQIYSAANCQGTPVATYNFNATVVVGPVGASTALVGATDADITPDDDIFGCGAHQTAYTIFKFLNNCTQLQGASGPASCTANNRPNTLEADVFTKQ